MSHNETSDAEARNTAATDIWEYGVKVVTLQQGKWPEEPPLIKMGDIVQVGEGTLKVMRGKDVMLDMPLVEEFSRWGRGQKVAGAEVVAQIEYTQNSHPKCSQIIYGSFVFIGLGNDNTPEPIVGVWGAETPPPGRTGDYEHGRH
jgi:hypothetical protein